jgi:hypothetical protein
MGAPWGAIGGTDANIASRPIDVVGSTTVSLADLSI